MCEAVSHLVAAGGSTLLLAQLIFCGFYKGKSLWNLRMNKVWCNSEALELKEILAHHLHCRTVDHYERA